MDKEHIMIVVSLLLILCVIGTWFLVFEARAECRAQGLELAFPPFSCASP